MTIEVLRNKTPKQIRADVNGFALRYVKDWDAWLIASSGARPELFGRILRKWQATRPRAMRRLRIDAQHKAPFLDELLEDAEEPLRTLQGLSLDTVAQKTSVHSEAFNTLWSIFSRLPTSGVASCVGISKAILLLTNGRIGPALDSQVRKTLRVARPITCSDWLQVLEDIGADIAAFEHAHGPLSKTVPARFAGLEYGRLYDMALGPR